MTSSNEPTEPTETTDVPEAGGARLELARFPETLAVVRLAAGSDLPEWAESSSVFAIVANATHTTLVCAGRSVPRKVPQRKPFTAFVVEARHEGSESTTERVPGDLTALLALLGPLAEAGLEAVPVATFDADWVLVPAAQADRAEEAWRRSGHSVAPAVPV